MNKISLFYPKFILFDGEKVSIKDCNSIFKFFAPKPIQDFIPPDNFPKHCPYTIDAKVSITKWFSVFPNDSAFHEKLLQTDWFNKSNFNDLPKKILLYFEYTKQHIINQIDHDDWYKVISDYIRYIQFGFDYYYKFGQIGFDVYVEVVTNFLNNSKIPKDKKERLLIFLTKPYFQSILFIVNSSIEDLISKNSKFSILQYKSFSSTSNPNLQNEIFVREPYSYNSEERKEIEQAVGAYTDYINDIGEFERTYKRWLNAFPFDISYFNEAHKEFENKMKDFIGTEYNCYMSLTVDRWITQTEILNFLKQETKELIEPANIKTMIASGYIDNIDRVILEMALAQNKKRTFDIFNKYTEGELGYAQAIDNWLEIQLETLKLFKSLNINEYQKKSKEKNENIKTFKDCFKNPEHSTTFIEMLHSYERPLLDSNGKWLKEGNSKMKWAIPYAINLLRRKGLIIDDISNELIRLKFNHETGSSIEKRTFQESGTNNSDKRRQFKNHVLSSFNIS